MRPLITLAEVRARDLAGTLAGYSDAQVLQAIADVSALAESPGIIGHAFPYYADRTFTFLGDSTDTFNFWGFAVPLAAAPTHIDGAAFDADAFDLLPIDGPPYEQIRYRDGYWTAGTRVLVRAAWGWSGIPDDVITAAFMCVRRYLLDSGYAAEVSGAGSADADIRGVTVGESSVNVQFGETAAAATVTSHSTGIPAADRVFRSYRRGAGGAVV